MSQFEHLFKPITVGNLQLKNRLFMDAMAVGYLDEEGRPNERLKTFLVERARGGVGFISVSCGLSKAIFRLGPGLGDDSIIPSLRVITDAIHAEGIPVAAEIVILSEWTDGKQPLRRVGPSAVSIRPGVPPSVALTIDEIHEIEAEFAAAALRAKAAGFDAVELMAGAGNLFTRFISPATNKREDEYGGSLEKRMRFMTEVITEIRKATGPDFPIGCRFSPIDFIEGGHELKEGKQVAILMEKAGLAWLSTQVGWHDSQIPMLTKDVEEGHWSYIAQGIKEVVKIPVVTSYQISDPLIAERVLAEGKADLIGMARALIADPDYANKVKEGRLDDLRRCIYCCRCLDQAIALEVPLDICSVNPRIGQELDKEITPAAKPKKVLIIGSGPGGMEAARIATLRGHNVTIIDRNPRPGGLMLLASLLNPEVDKIVKFQTRQLAQLGVKIRLNTEATAALIRQEKPDAVILAVGGLPPLVQIPGADGSNVFALRDSIEMLTGRSGKPKLALAGLFLRYFYNPSLIRSLMKLPLPYPFGKRVVVIGGKFGGLEFAETLSENGRQVTVLEETARVGYDIGPVSRWITLARIKNFGAKTETNVKVTEITGKSVKGVKTSKEGKQTPLEVEADTVLIALDLRENKELATALEGSGIPCYLIGDATERKHITPPQMWGPLQPRRIGESIKAGYQAAMDI
ncbi:MAG: FAD-dependent oxidoreductase [Smithellaceae bacterium]